MASRARHLGVIVQRARRNPHAGEILIQVHHDRRATTRAEKPRGEITRSPFCGLRFPLYVLLREKHEGDVWGAGLFAAFDTVAVGDSAWGCGGGVADVAASAAS